METRPFYDPPSAWDIEMKRVQTWMMWQMYARLLFRNCYWREAPHD